MYLLSKLNVQTALCTLFSALRRPSLCGLILVCFLLSGSLPLLAQQKVPPVHHSRIGDSVTATNKELTIRMIGKRQRYCGEAATRDEYIHSPKSVHIHPNGKKFYVNSLEGGSTVVYEMGSFKRLKVVDHHLGAEHDHLWSQPSDFYPFTHYPKNNHFMGKPVESAFSHNGRYLWVPYYRRTYDINAQDPSAVAVIDTETDEIVRLMETGPLPKMIAASPDGRTIAISHWGNNTVGLIDISSQKPEDWHHKACLVVDYVLPLNYSTTVPVDRDNKSGYALRGTVFTPDSRYLLVGCMGGGGGIAVIDLKDNRYMGRVLGMMANVRHLIISGGYLYLSINAAGYVQRIPLDTFIAKAKELTGTTVRLSGWEQCKVGQGARTIEASPSGRYIFAACNIVSQLYVVSTATMQPIASITVDSYPVGLDVSEDGRYVFVTSQGRSGKGGNAVNIFEVEYATPEIPEKTAADTAQIVPTAADGAVQAAANGGKAQQDGESILSRFLSCFTASTEESGSGFPYLPVAIGAGVVILIAGVYVVKHRSCS